MACPPGSERLSHNRFADKDLAARGWAGGSEGITVRTGIRRYFGKMRAQGANYAPHRGTLAKKRAIWLRRNRLRSSGRPSASAP